MKFYLTHEHACSYLVDKQATTLFLDPFEHLNQSLHSDLSRHGFRRSGNYLYKPHCNGCQACIPVRVLVELFSPNRSQRRTLKKNRHLVKKQVDSHFAPKHYSLYHNYISARHADGDMFPPSEEQFRGFLLSDWSQPQFFEYYQDNKLVACAVVDVLDDGHSALYSYYDPKLLANGIGNFLILDQIETVKQTQKPHLYLGFWVKNCQKMTYKTTFQPIEAFIQQQWQRLPES